MPVFLGMFLAYFILLSNCCDGMYFYNDGYVGVTCTNIGLDEKLGPFVLLYCVCWHSVQVDSQFVHLVKERLVFSGCILKHLFELMIDGHARNVGHSTLCLLNSSNLELQEELGHLDGKVSSSCSDTRLGSKVNIQLVLKLVDIVVRQG